MLQDESKRQIDFESMTSMMVNVFNELFPVVDKVALSEIR